MPLYFFDINDGEYVLDETGTECADHEAACVAAMVSLPAIAGQVVRTRGDKQAYTVMVRDEHGTTIYAASLNFVGTRLGGEV